MDPISAIGIAGGAIQITTLITKTIHGLSSLHGKFSNADLTLNSLIAELLTIKAAITQLHELAQYNLNRTPKHPEYIEGLDVALDGCTAIVDVLSEEVAQLTPISSNAEPLRGMGLRAKVKVIWKEDLMKEHSQMLHAQITISRTSSEQLELLRRQENRDIIKRVLDDTITLRSTISIAGARTDEASSSIRGSCTGNTVFEFDQILLNEGPYRRAMRNYQLSTRKSAVLPNRQNSTSTTMSGTDEGYASGTSGSRTPSILLRKFLSSTNYEGALGIRPYEALKSHDDVSRRHTISIGRSPSSKTDKVLGRSKSAAPALGQRSSGSTKEKLLSTLRRLNTTNRSTTSLKTSPTSGSAKRRRNRVSESNVSIDLMSMDSITTPPIVRATQAGATIEVENFIKSGADLETRDATTGRNALAVAAHCGKEDIVRLLIYYNAKLDTQDAQLSTPLHLAASRGHTRVLQLLLEEDAEVDLKDANGRTAFMVAANAGHAEAVKILLDNNCKINTRATDQMTALHVATKNGDHEIVSLLLFYGVDIEAKDVNMMTAIHHACEGGHVAIVELLINHKANIEAVGEHQKTPLICSAANGHFTTTDLLLRKKAISRSKDEHGMNALHWAAFNGHTEIVGLLLQKKGSMGSQNLQGRTALHLATMNKQFAVVEFLLRKKAPFEARCHQGFTALHYACSSMYVDLVRLLLAAGADIEAQVGDHQHRPIHLAVSLGSLELTKFLCEKGVSVDAPDSDSTGRRALSIACRSGNLEIAQELLRFGAQSRILLPGNILEDSPICIASKMGHASVVSLLLGNGSSALENDEKGWSPILYAAHYGHPQVLAILLQYYRPTADTRLFHMFIGIGFASDATISQEDREQVQHLIQQVKDTHLPIARSQHELPLETHPTCSAIPPGTQRNSSRYPWEPQAISATPAYDAPVPLLSIRLSSPPIELPTTVGQGLPDRHHTIQERGSQGISPPKSLGAWIQPPELPLSRCTSRSVIKGAYLKNAFMRLPVLGYIASNTRNHAPSTNDAECTAYVKPRDDLCYTMNTRVPFTRATVPLVSETSAQPENGEPGQSIQPPGHVEDREPGEDDSIDNDEDDNDDCSSDPGSTSTVFTALGVLGAELDDCAQIYELAA
ncbi:hypothetical protein EMCG_00427 [[Emmonsia] crescens]|uniref:Uncharacterized protein n=1 Tax=[Emmonsia] crescens TaxID=73230 RepID=A0A0G2HWU8_9EURO|nr:hypothetical protein EMCG_00427 [Emmonsia crescens UAMH 3008]